jgi:hypothetical protein
MNLKSFWSMGASDGDLQIYTNLEFCEENNHENLENILIYKVKQFIPKNIIMFKKMVQVVCK